MNVKDNASGLKTLKDAIQFFADPDAALQYAIPVVWPDGITCPHCNDKGNHHFIATRRIWRCAACKKQFSIKLGTVMEDSPIGLDVWFPAIWLIANAKNGISSYEIHRALGVTQKTAWFLLHRIRTAMKTGTFRKMSGTVEADEHYVGGLVQNFKKSKRKALAKESKKQKPFRPAHIGRVSKKTIVMGLIERGQGDQPSQASMRVVDTARRGDLEAVVRENVEPGSFLMTDALLSYKRLQDQYIHMSINHAITYAAGRIHTNSMENFWSLFSRTIHGTYVAVEPFHLDRYLDEQCFRFNSRKMNDAQRFAKTLGMIGGKRITYEQLTGKTVEGERPADLPN